MTFDKKNNILEAMKWFRIIEDGWVEQYERGEISKWKLQRLLKQSERSRLATVAANKPRLRTSIFTKDLFKDVPTYEDEND